MSLLAQKRKIIIVQLFYLWLYLFLFKNTNLLHGSESSKMKAQKGKDQTRVKEKRWEEAELQTGLLDCCGC